MYSRFRTLLTRRFNLPKERSMQKAIRSFTLAERAVFYFFVVIFIMSGVWLLAKVNSAYLVRVPIEGGTLTEGIIGNPRFINPVLAQSQADKDLTALIYSGLVRIDTDGTTRNDLAESISVSDDGLLYTIHIRPDAIFQDKTKVTSDDVIFTLEKILDPAVKSPFYGNFAGVSTERIDDTTLVITLKKPYAPFINNLSIGILPRHIWGSVSAEQFLFSEWNILPIGSGIYKIDSVERNSGGIPNYYDLVADDSPVSKKPFITHIVFKFYPNSNDLLEAYEDGDIESFSGISPDDARVLKGEGANIIATPLPRVFGVFFNENANKVLLDEDVRKALDFAAPKEDIVKNVLESYGTVANGPIPTGIFEPASTTIALTSEKRLEEASALLANAGWTKNANGVLEKKKGSATLSLSFSISTGNTPELKEVAELVKNAWTSLGAHVDLLVYDTGDLNQNVIRPRSYDALLFGEVIGRDADVYPFWHSSQRNDPGLNIALYANPEADSLLSSARSERDPAKRVALYREFDSIIREDMPAAFLYSPSFLYVMPDKVQGIAIAQLGHPEDRFLGIRDWYIETSSVWKLFTNNF